MTGADDVWSSFSRDPRVDAHRPLRASDADREVVHHVLTEAYADGRLDRVEFDARATEVTSARTLGELPPIVEGLVPLGGHGPAAPGSGLMTDAQLHERAVADWRGDRRDALWGFIAASLICWTIWLVGSWGQDGFDFPWPVFVSLGTGLNVGRAQFQRDERIASAHRRLEKKQRMQLEAPRPKDDE